jgi:hypothetical protein
LNAGAAEVSDNPVSRELRLNRGVTGGDQPYPKYDPVTHILVVKTEHEDTDVTTVTRYRIATNGNVKMIH